MPYNPSTSRAECNYHAGLVNQDSKNQPQTSNRESYNTFDKRHSVADTQLFDEVRPFYMDMANSGDVKRARMVNNDWSPVTKSQILNDIKKHRALFQVPWSSIMPHTWEYLYREPVAGDDVVFTNVAPIIDKSALSSLLQFIFSPGAVASNNASNRLDVFFRMIWLYYSMFGASSLPETLGVRILSPKSFVFRGIDGEINYDCSPESVFSRLCNVIANGVKVTVGGSEVSASFGTTMRFMPEVTSTPSGSASQFVFGINSPQDAFNFLREFIWYSQENTLSVIETDFPANSVNWTYLFSYVLYGIDTFDAAPEFSSIDNLFDETISARLSQLPADYGYNLMPLIAYQCVWHQFFTNDRIDPVYSARMWQESIFSWFCDFVESKNANLSAAFYMNGVRVPYDAYSGYVISQVSSYLIRGGASVDMLSMQLSIDYFNEVFSLRPSMRGSDYFTSMRISPLAVGNVDVTVNAGKVSAIDVNQSLWYQRFLNAVNRTKQSIYDYLQSMTGVRPERVEPQPNFIVEEVFNIAGMQVENNSEKQGQIVSILRNSQSNYLYDIFIDEPSFIIGVDSYSVSYVYPDSSNRISMMQDRLDWFNDFMQHIGDQQVNLGELFTPSSLETISNPIGYQLRYAEFKNMISRACGGFIIDDSDLRSWLLLYLPGEYLGYQVNSMSVISPYFIRNHASDFDALFASLTGTNPSNRYHVIKYTYVDEVDNSKQQAYPSLL